MMMMMMMTLTWPRAGDPVSLGARVIFFFFFWHGVGGASLGVTQLVTVLRFS